MTDNIDEADRKINKLADTRSSRLAGKLLDSGKILWYSWGILIQDCKEHISVGGSIRGPGAAVLRDRTEQLTLEVAFWNRSFKEHWRDAWSESGERMDDGLCNTELLHEPSSSYQNLMYDDSECDWSSSTPAAIHDWRMKTAKAQGHEADPDTFSEPDCFRENLMDDGECDWSSGNAETIQQWMARFTISTSGLDFS